MPGQPEQMHQRRIAHPAQFNEKQWMGITQSMFPRAGLDEDKRKLVMDMLGSEAQLRSKAKGLLAELYNTKDVKEAVACVK